MVRWSQLGLDNVLVLLDKQESCGKYMKATPDAGVSNPNSFLRRRRIVASRRPGPAEVLSTSDKSLAAQREVFLAHDAFSVCRWARASLSVRISATSSTGSNWHDRMPAGCAWYFNQPHRDLGLDPVWQHVSSRWAVMVRLLRQGVNILSLGADSLRRLQTR